MPDVRATYRLQLHHKFTFRDAAEIVPYLAALGISHLYLSPVLQAAPRSSHGYDVVDPTRLSDELGGEDGFRHLQTVAREAGLGLVIDVVPNHMAIGGPENRWWWDLLEHGPWSRFALYFDVAWNPPEPSLRDRILVPILGDHYGRVLEAADLQLEREGVMLQVRYVEHRYPVAPESVGRVLEAAAGKVPPGNGGEELRGIASRLATLPRPALSDRSGADARYTAAARLGVELNKTFDEHHAAVEAVDETIAAINADPDRLDALLEEQHYRLARWQTASWDLDYRRFFDINDLAAIRVDDVQVFAATHRLVIRWLREGAVDGVRIDHPDGLRDPGGYLERLRDAAPDAFIVVEKILHPGEGLPEAWPVEGTTGYDFAQQVTGLFIEPAGERPLTEFYQAFTGEDAGFSELSYQCKHQVMRELLGSDVRRLLNLLSLVCQQRRRFRDFTQRELEQSLREVMACFPVYRSYVHPGRPIRAADRDAITTAVHEAQRRLPGGDPELFTFLQDLLLLAHRGRSEEEFVARFQETTAPVTAKAIEDTALYRFNRLVALNEVGGDPATFGVAPEDFHRACVATLQRWPNTMLTGSTHDTKRSEDVRARLALLSQIPERWERAVRRWSTANARYRHGEYPDRNLEYLLYQTLVGAYPIPPDRLRQFAEKASREAKVHTSWVDRNERYDQAVRGFVDGISADPMFQADLRDFVEPLLRPGWTNAVAARLLTLTAPGVGDIYQGTELWDLSLVDPDNRRPVDFELRRRLLEELGQVSAATCWERADQGLPKLLVTIRALKLRRRCPDAFGPQGSYEPLTAIGPGADRVVAFIRGGHAITVVPRLALGGRWCDTSLPLPDGRWSNVLTGDDLTGGGVAVDALFEAFPVALLQRHQ